MSSPFQYVSFAGVSLTCLTPDLQDEINRLLPEYERDDWNGWNFANAGTSMGPLPTPTAPVAPKLPIGTLHWPNDATRPAWFKAVVTKEILDRINEVYTGPEQGAYLVLKDGRDGKLIEAKMSMLPPRPISQLGLDSDGWLLTFTDQRFWWQWRSGSISEAPLSWTALFNEVADLIGVLVDVDDIDAAYGTPTEKWIGYLRPPATLLDAVAASVGQRIVVALNGDVRSVNWETAQEESDAQWLELIPSMGGYSAPTEIGKYVPAEVNVAGIDRTVSGPNGEIVPKVDNKTLGALGIPAYGSSVGVDGAISTVFVDFEYTGPSDDAAWNALVDAAAEDWYGWRLADLDISYPGITPWEPTGWEDFTQWQARLTPATIDSDNPHEPLISTTVRRPPWSNFPSTILPVNLTNRVYWVKLTGSGVGIDGGTAWGGLIQIEENGDVINNGYIGADSTTETFCMYKTLANDGTAGNPEVGDVVCAIPDPSMPGVWLFQPKKTTFDDCGSCGWLSDLKITSCLYAYMRGGRGRCECIPTDCFNCEQDPEVECQPTPMIWTASENAWLSTSMKNTCCGCGQMYFRITDPENEEAQVQIADIHISCENASGTQELLTITLKQECCGINRCGNSYVLFRGKGTGACNGEEANCGNEFYVMIECAPCPPLDCSCCCIEESPPAYYQNFTSGLFIGGGNEELNGRWVWTKNNTDPARPCLWEANCDPTGRTSTIERIGDEFVLDHDGFIYKIDAADWDCSGTNTLTYDSGGSGSYPPTVVLNPMLPLNFETESPDPLACTPPDEVTIEIVSADCPILNTTQVLTREGPSSNAWGWINPSIEGDRITIIQLACVEGSWAVSASAVCAGEPSPWGLATNSRPDTQEFDPFELAWNSVDIGGLDPSPTPACCNIGTAVVTVTE